MDAIWCDKARRDRFEPEERVGREEALLLAHHDCRMQGIGGWRTALKADNGRVLNLVGFLPRRPRPDDLRSEAARPQATALRTQGAGSMGGRCPQDVKTLVSQ